MKTLKSILLASAVAGAILTGCQTTASAPAVETVEQMKTRLMSLGETSVGATHASQSELDAWFQLLPFLSSLEVGGYDTAADGGHVAKDVVLAFADDVVGVKIGELHVLGAGAQTYETDLATRIDMRNVEFVGGAKLMESLTDDLTIGLVEGMVEAVGEDADDIDLEMDTEFSAYDIKADRILLDGLTLHDVSLTTEAADEFGGVLQIFGQLMASYSWDAAMIDGQSVVINMDQSMSAEGEDMDQSFDMSFAAPKTVYGPYDRGDMSFALVKDMAFDYAIEQDIEDSDSPMAQAIQGGSTAFEIKDLRLKEFSEYALLGKLLPRDSRALSLGVWTSEGEHQSLNGAPYVKSDKTVVDLSQFQWVIPTHIGYQLDGGELSLKGLTEYVKSTLAQTGEDADLEEMVAGLDQFLPILADNDLETLKLDGDYALDWNPDTGAFSWQGYSDIKGLFEITENVEGALVDWAVLNAAIPSEEGMDFGGDALVESLMEQGAFSGANYTIKDNGGLEKVFSVVVAVAQAFPSDDPGAAMIQNSTPETLRSSAQGMIRMAAFAAAEEFPPAVGYINSFADFVQQGGEFNITMAPPVTVNKASFEALIGADPEAGMADVVEPTPDMFVDFFGLSVTHTKPEAAE